MRLPVAFCLLLNLTGCAYFLAKEPSYGLKPDYDAFVPARVSVLDCSVVPLNFRPIGQEPGNIKSEDLPGLLQACDNFVLKGFANQPYMQGYTPKAVRQLLQQKQKDDLLASVFSSWQILSHSDDACGDVAELYEKHLVQDINWQKWLHEFAEAARFSDTLLIPLITDAREEQIDVRGVYHSKRSLAVNLLLVDTNNAKIIWAAKRSTNLSKTRYPSDQESGYAPYPKWEILTDRIFQEVMWKDFPGRIER